MTTGQAKRRIALKGQSRSKFCGEPVRKGGKQACLRLAGHKGSHRKSTFRNAPKVAEAAAEPTVTVIPQAPDPDRTQSLRTARRQRRAPNTNVRQTDRI